MIIPKDSSPTASLATHDFRWHKLYRAVYCLGGVQLAPTQCRQRVLGPRCGVDYCCGRFTPMCVIV